MLSAAISARCNYVDARQRDHLYYKTMKPHFEIMLTMPSLGRGLTRAARGFKLAAREQADRFLIGYSYLLISLTVPALFQTSLNGAAKLYETLHVLPVFQQHQWILANAIARSKRRDKRVDDPR